MGIRQIRKRLRMERKNMLRRFVREKRLNLLAEPGKHEYVIVLDHLNPDFNIGKIFRSADAFGAREVHLIGTDFFSPVPAMGSFKWVPAKFHETFDTCYEELRERGYTFFTMEPSAEETVISASLTGQSAFVFGSEGLGIRFDKSDYDGIRSLRIPQSGKVESLNVSIAASIVMYEYVRQYHGERQM